MCSNLLLLVVVIWSEESNNDVKQEENVYNVVEYLLTFIWTWKSNIEWTCDRWIPDKYWNPNIPDVYFHKSILWYNQIVIPRSLLFNFVTMYSVRSKGRPLNAFIEYFNIKMFVLVALKHIIVFDSINNLILLLDFAWISSNCFVSDCKRDYSFLKEY